MRGHQTQAIRVLLYKITLENKEALIDEFLKHKVFEWPSLLEVISIIFDKAIEKPEYCALYASLCQRQVAEELRLNNDVSNFRNALLLRAQQLTTWNLEDQVNAKEAEIASETDQGKKNEKIVELFEIQNNFSIRKLRSYKFLGHLFLSNLISVRIIDLCVAMQLKSVTERPENLDGYKADDESVECAVRLLEIIGQRLQEEANRIAAVARDNASLTGTRRLIQLASNLHQPAFPLGMTFQTLEGAIPIVSNRIQLMILKLIELRKNGWVAREVNSEDESEQDELREKQFADLTTRCMYVVCDYAIAEITLDEAREEIFKSVDNVKFSKPSLQTVFKCFMAAAVKAPSPSGVELLPTFGHLLAYCLLKKAEEKNTKSRDEILKGVAECIRDMVEQEKWQDVPKIWEFTAEVLIHAHMPEEGLFEGAHPTLNDFRDSFFNAAKCETKPYALFVLVLKRLAEIHYKRDKNVYLEICSWVLDECPTILRHMDEEKLNNELEATKMEFAENLFVIMRQDFEQGTNNARQQTTSNAQNKQSTAKGSNPYENVSEATQNEATRHHGAPSMKNDRERNAARPVKIARDPKPETRPRDQETRPDYSNIDEARAVIERLQVELAQAQSACDEKDRKIEELEKKYKQSLIRFGRGI